MVAGIGAALGAAGSIAGSFMSAGAQDEANKTNRMINMMNFMMRQQERQDAIDAANEQKLMAREGTTDASGNTTRYVPGEGWVSTLSARSRSLKNQQDAEQGHVLGRDTTAKRGQMFRNLERQLDEGLQADEYKRQLDDVDVDPERLAGEMTLSASRGIDGQYDEATSAAMRNAIRTGSSNTGRILSDFAKAKAKTQGDVFAGIPVQARQQAAAMEGQQKQQLTNLYNTFATRAGQMPGVSYQAQNLTGDANSFLSRDSSRGDAAGNTLINALARNGGSVDYVTPNDGMGSALAITGQSLGAVFDKFSGQADKDQAYQNFLKRYNTGGGGGTF